MRILHVNKYLYRRGGAEAYMLDLADEQRAAGDEVEFFSMHHPDNMPARFEDAFPPYAEFGSIDQPAAEKIRLTALAFHSTPARSGIDRVVREYRPDIVHMHNIYHQLSPAILAPPASLGIPVVMTLHDYKLACPSYRFLAGGSVCEACIGGAFWNAPLKRCNKGSLGASLVVAAETAWHRWSKAYRGVRRFLCPSEFLRSKMIQANVFPDRMRAVPNFVPVDDFDVKTSPGGDVVFIGRLASEKGVDVLVRAAAIGRFRVNIVGDGPERLELERLAVETGAEATFTGHLAREELLHLLRASTVSVLPARWYENQPISVIESFASGVPVVATDIGGLPELVRPGETGTLVPVDDPHSLAAAVRSYVDDPAIAMRRGIAARAMAESDFTPKVHLGRVQQVYEEAMTE